MVKEESSLHQQTFLDPVDLEAVLMQGLRYMVSWRNGIVKRTGRVPSCMQAGASSPLAEEVSLARRSVPRLRIAFLLASALAAADMVVQACMPLNKQLQI